MLPGFVIWTAVAVLLAGLGVHALKSPTPVGFYAGTEPPKVKETRRYNRSVALLWFGYAAAFEALGLPFLTLKQNAAGFLVPLLGTVAITVALLVIYQAILRRHEEPAD